jgi:hypothetical protein
MVADHGHRVSATSKSSSLGWKLAWAGVAAVAGMTGIAEVDQAIRVQAANARSWS